MNLLPYIPAAITTGAIAFYFLRSERLERQRDLAVNSLDAERASNLTAFTALLVERDDLASQRNRLQSELTRTQDELLSYQSSVKAYKAAQSEALTALNNELVATKRELELAQAVGRLSTKRADHLREQNDDLYVQQKLDHAHITVLRHELRAHRMYRKWYETQSVRLVKEWVRQDRERLSKMDYKELMYNLKTMVLGAIKP